MKIRNNILYIIGNLYPSILGFIIVPFLTYALTPSDYGVLSYVNSIIAFMCGLFTLGFNTYLFRSYSIAKYQLYNFENFYSIFWGLFFISLTLSIFFLFLFNVFNVSSTIDLSKYSLYIVGITFIVNQALIPMAFLRIKEKAVVFFIAIFIATSLEYILIFGLVILMDLGVEGRLSSKFLASFILVIFTLLYFKKILFSSKFLKLKHIYAAFRYGSSFAVGAIFFILIDVSDKFILERFVSLDQLGLYGVSYSIAFVLMSLNRGLSKAFQPNLIKVTKENDHLKLKTTIINTKKYINIITFVTTICFLFAIELMITFTFESSYSGVIEYIIFLTMVPIIYIHYNIYSSVLIALGEKYFYIISMFIGMVINITFNMIMIPIFGVNGAIISTVLAYLIMFLYTFWEFKKIAKIEAYDETIAAFSLILLASIAIIYFDYFNSVLLHFISVLAILTWLFSYIYFHLKIKSFSDFADLL